MSSSSSLDPPTATSHDDLDVPVSIAISSESSDLLNRQNSSPSSLDPFNTLYQQQHRTTTRVNGMTRAEVLTSMANRLLHSKFYKWLYLAMMILSFLCLVLSFIQQCPSGLYYWLDAAVNLIMILEVLIRVNAMGKNFWKSIWNILDIGLVFLCILTLFWLLFGECQADSTNNWETELDALLLIARNGVQLFRLVSMVNKNRERLLGRGGTPAAIDFRNAAPPAVVDFLGTTSGSGASIDLSRSTAGNAAGHRVSSSVFDFEGEEEDWGF